MRVAVRVIAMAAALCTAMSVAQSQKLPARDELLAKRDEALALAAELERHDKIGDCKFLDDFVDRNIRNSDTAGFVARFFAIGSLIRSSKDRCLYHDRGLATRVAIEQYEAEATAAVSPPVAFRAEPYLEAACGSAWRERLAEAGVRAAAQDIVARHLMCALKGGKDARAFWDWIAEGSRGSGRDVQQHLEMWAEGFFCTRMAAAADLTTACYWNLFEDRW